MGEMALVQQEEFTESCGRFASLPTETVFAYCSFEGFEISRPSVGGVILGCSFTRMSWYWELFNTALISRTSFEDCVFRGCSFRGVDLLIAPSRAADSNSTISAALASSATAGWSRAFSRIAHS